MLKYTLPVCYFPTTVYMVDDNEAFLSNLSLSINHKIPTQFSTNPLEAINFLKEKHLRLDLPINVHLELEDQQVAHFDVKKLFNTVNNPNRFDATSVLLVDYSMPQMTGIELCQQLQDIPVKKVMITGEADLQTAIMAFNANLIDKFIVKSSPQFREQIEKAITELQYKYFIDLSQYLLKDLQNSLLTHHAFHIFFENVKQKLHATEFYLLDNQGSFLFLNEKAEPTIIAVKSDSDLKDYYHIAKDNEAPTNIINSLHNKTKLPFFLNTEHLQAPVDQWEKFLHHAEVIPGIENAYFAKITPQDKPFYFETDAPWIGIVDYLMSV